MLPSSKISVVCVPFIVLLSRCTGPKNGPINVTVVCSSLARCRYDGMSASGRLVVGLTDVG